MTNAFTNGRRESRDICALMRKLNEAEDKGVDISFTGIRAINAGFICELRGHVPRVPNASGHPHDGVLSNVRRYTRIVDSRPSYTWGVKEDFVTNNRVGPVTGCLTAAGDVVYATGSSIGGTVPDLVLIDSTGAVGATGNLTHQSGLVPGGLGIDYNDEDNTVWIQTSANGPQLRFSTYNGTTLALLTTLLFTPGGGGTGMSIDQSSDTRWSHSSSTFFERSRSTGLIIDSFTINSDITSLIEFRFNNTTGTIWAIHSKTSSDTDRWISEFNITTGATIQELEVASFDGSASVLQDIAIDISTGEIYVTHAPGEDATGLDQETRNRVEIYDTSLTLLDDTWKGGKIAETEFFRYDAVNVVTSLGTPDSGDSIPALDALNVNDDIDTNSAQVVGNHITDMRDRIEVMAELFLEPDATTVVGGTMNWFSGPSPYAIKIGNIVDGTGPTGIGIPESWLPLDDWIVTPLSNFFEPATIIVGTDGKDYRLTREHKASTTLKPITGGTFTLVWTDNGTSGEGFSWVLDRFYIGPKTYDMYPWEIDEILNLYLDASVAISSSEATGRAEHPAT